MNISQLQSETFMTFPPPPTCKMSESEKITGEYEVLLGFSMGGGLAMELALRLMVRLKGLAGLELEVYNDSYNNILV